LYVCAKLTSLQRQLRGLNALAKKTPYLAFTAGLSIIQLNSGSKASEKEQHTNTHTQNKDLNKDNQT